MRRLAGVLLIALAFGFAPSPVSAQVGLLEGKQVAEIRISGLMNLTPDRVERHLATRVGQPFHQADLVTDRRQLDELRVFSSVSLVPTLENDRVVLQVAVTETLRLLLPRMSEERESAMVQAVGVPK